MSKKSNVKSAVRGREHKPDAPCKQADSHKFWIDSCSSDDKFWLFADPLTGGYATHDNETEMSCLAVFASEAVARAEAGRSHFLRQMVAHDASWAEVQAIAEQLCDGRWCIVWAQPVAQNC